ncbi:MAG: S8 family serine peptidase [Clostridia bacterium]|nr:S8 family serine peptidase [Clostridia bacterium]
MKKFVALFMIVALCLFTVQPILNYDHIVCDEEMYFCDAEKENIIKINDSLAFVNNEVIVFFNNDTTDSQKKDIISSIGGRVVGCYEEINEYQIRIKERDIFSLLSTVKSLQKDDNVSFATCNFVKKLSYDSIPNDPWTMSGDDYTYGWDESRPNGGNWWLEVTQTLSAWEYEEYFNPITVGIIDGGFDPEHEDLKGKISFPNEFFEKNNAPDYHGMHVAGIIGANQNNGIGISGICEKAELLCVDWEANEDQDQNWISELRIVTAFISLVRSGAKVINMSLGASSNLTPDNGFFWNILMELDGALFSYIMSSLLLLGYDFIVVQSAGNGDYLGTPCDTMNNGNFCSITRSNCLSFLSGIRKQDVLDRIIVAGSICNSHEDQNFYQSSFSNYGDNVSIFAPGSRVYSCYTNNEYRDLSGTSMAAPVVTGITSLVWSVNPDLKGSDVKKIICDPDNSIYTAVNYFEPEKDIPSGNIINAKLSVEDAIRTLGIEPEIKESEKTEVTGSSSIETAESFRNEKGE